MEIPIEEAIFHLKNNLGKIFYVNEWAQFMGYSRVKFYRCFRIHFSCSPQEVLIEIKKKAIKKRLRENPNEILIKTALEIGFKNDKALCDFTRIHMKTTPEAIKKNGKCRIQAKSFFTNKVVT